MKEILIPEKLKKGDKVGIISPASPVEKREIEASVKFFEEYGLAVSFGKYAFTNRGYLSGTDTERLEDLLRFWADPDIKAVFCTRGGYGSLKLLRSLDFHSVMKLPKILVGYSDITALLLAMYEKANLMTFHGPVLKDASPPRNIKGMLKYLSAPIPVDIRISDSQIIRPGLFKGRLIGGNLTVISHMVGTGFLPDPKGCVLFLEDIKEAPYRIDRALTQLKLSGYFNGIAGILLGNFNNCGPKDVITNIFADLAGELKIPCVAGLPIGHKGKNITIAIGSECLVDTYRYSIHIDPWCV